MTKTSQLPENVLNHSQALTTVATQQAIAALSKRQTTETFSHATSFGPSGLFSQQILTTTITPQTSTRQAANEVPVIKQAAASISEQSPTDKLLDNAQPSLEVRDLLEQQPPVDSSSESANQSAVEPELNTTTDRDPDQTVDSENINQTSFFAGRESRRSELVNKEKYFGELQHKIEELTSNTHNAQDKYEQAKADPRTSAEQLLFLKNEADRSQKELDGVQAISWTVSGEVEQAKSSLEEYEHANPQDSPPQAVPKQETVQSVEMPPQKRPVDSAEFSQDKTTDQNLRNKQQELDQSIKESADPEVIKGLIKEVEKLKDDVEQYNRSLNTELKELPTEQQDKRKAKLEQQLEKVGDPNDQTTVIKAEEDQQDEDNDESQTSEQEKREQQEKDRLKEKTELEANQKNKEAEQKRQQEEAAQEAARKAEAELAEQERLRVKKEVEEDNEIDAFDTLGRGILWVATVPALAQVALFTLSIPAAAAAMLMHATLTADQQTDQQRRRW